MRVHESLDTLLIRIGERVPRWMAKGFFLTGIGLSSVGVFNRVSEDHPAFLASLTLGMLNALSLAYADAFARNTREEAFLTHHFHQPFAWYRMAASTAFLLGLPLSLLDHTYAPPLASLGAWLAGVYATREREQA